MAFLLKEFAPEMFSKGLEVKATQTFKRRLAELKFRIEQQKLHREDIEDLVELTVGRMDIYHLVGALLLAFCVDFYCENGMLAESHSEESMPRWLVTLFLVSNFAAIGYLLFSVWLAMHASVSAHSVGVRLLTSFARLTIPTGKELKDIQQPVAPILERLGMVSGGGVDPDTEKAERKSKPVAAKLDNTKAVEHEISTYDKAVTKRSTVVVNNDKLTRASTARKSIMRSSTMRKSVMLGRGSTWGATPSTLGLDLGSVNSRPSRLRSSVASELTTFEESNAGTFASEVWTGGRGSMDSTHEVELTAMRESTPSSATDEPLRGPSWAESAPSVLDGDQLHDEELLESDHFKRYKAEQKTWLMYDAYCRVCMGLGVNQLLQALSYYIIAQVGKKSSVLSLISLLGVQLLSNLMGRLDMTHAEGGRGSFATSTRYFLLATTPPVAASCLLWMPPMLGDSQTEVHSHSMAAPIFLVHAAFMYNVVSFLMPDAQSDAGQTLPSRLRTVNYINVLGDDNRPPSRTSGRRGGAVLAQKAEKDAGPWGATVARKSVMQYAQEQAEADEPVRVSSGVSSQAAEGLVKGAGVDIVTDHNGMNRSPDDLPRIIVKTFTLGLAAIWVIGAFFHILVIFGMDLDNMAYPPTEPGHGHGGGHHTLLQMRAVGELRWPEPSRLFEASTLHCHSSGILVGDRFGVYAAEKADDPALAGSLGAFSLLARGSAAAVVCDGGSDCQVLLRSDREADGTSRLAPMALSGSGPPARPMSEVPIPSAWRLVAAVPMAARSCARGAADVCRTALLAGWDGSEITIADARETAQGGWRLQARFAVHPRLLEESGQAPGGDAYSDVVALQLAPNGASLSVMRASGVLDGWDLASGERLGQWHVGAHSQGPAAMCHDGRDLWLARRSGRASGGPALETVPLPAALASPTL